MRKEIYLWNSDILELSKEIVVLNSNKILKWQRRLKGKTAIILQIVITTKFWFRQIAIDIKAIASLNL